MYILGVINPSNRSFQLSYKNKLAFHPLAYTLDDLLFFHINLSRQAATKTSSSRNALIKVSRVVTETYQNI